MRKLFFAFVLIFAIALFTACGGGGSSTFQPAPGAGGVTSGGQDFTSGDEIRSVSLSGLLTYTGIMQADDGFGRVESASPIANAGVILFGDNAVLSATTTDDSGWFELASEGVGKAAELMLKVELSVGESTGSWLYAELPFALVGSGPAECTLSLSAYDGDGDGIPDGLRLDGGITGGSFGDGLFSSGGLDMPFGESGNHFGWESAGKGFFEDGETLGLSGSGEFDVANFEGDQPPGEPSRPGNGGMFNNRIEVRGKVVEVSPDRNVYLAEGRRLVFIFGLVFEESGRFPVHATDNTVFKGFRGFGDIKLGMKTRAVGRRIVDNVLQANLIEGKMRDAPSRGFFAVDGKTIHIEFDPRETWPPLGAVITVKGVLIMFKSDSGFADYKFGEFHVGVTTDTILVGLKHLGELEVGRQVSLFGQHSDEKLHANLLIQAPGDFPPPPPQHGNSFFGEVFGVDREHHLVGVLGHWGQMIDHGGMNMPPDGNRDPMNMNEGGDPAGNFPPDDTRPDLVRLWIKIAPDTRLLGVPGFDGIRPGQRVWSAMKVGDDGRVMRDDAGHPIAALFEVLKAFPPPHPSLFGRVVRVRIFDDDTSSVGGHDGVVAIAPHRDDFERSNGGEFPPGDSGNPSDPDVEAVPVRVDPRTEFSGFASLHELKIKLTDTDAFVMAEALFRLNEDGRVARDDAGRPVASVLKVFTLDPPPPPKDFITIEGTVIEYVESAYIIVSPIWGDGDPGIMEFKFLITNRTKIESRSGIQVGDQVMVEGIRNDTTDGQGIFIALFILEFEFVP